MFGFSITKLLFTAAVIVGILYVFKRLNGPKKVPDRRERRERRNGPPIFKHSAAEIDSEEMVQCPKCGTYALPGKKCEKDRCPM